MFSCASSAKALAVAWEVVLAVLIPWMLATAALPLETIVRNTVFIIQLVGAYVLLIVSFICKTLSNLFKSLGRFVLTIYDLIIFAPLWVERTIKAEPARVEAVPATPPKAAAPVDAGVLGNNPHMEFSNQAYKGYAIVTANRDDLRVRLPKDRTFKFAIYKKF